jgi:hypothetical protein
MNNGTIIGSDVLCCPHIKHTAHPHYSRLWYKMVDDNKDKMSKQLDAQILELEQRFNAFLKELEDDFDFVPSAVAGKQKEEDDYYPEFDHRLSDIEKKYATVDRKYTIVLIFTTLLMLSVLGYVGYLLFGKG